MGTATGPENTAVRVALWRAIHVESDAKPPVLDDTVGLKLVDPPANWRERGDMHPEGTKLFRASIVSRARFIEDQVAEQAARGVTQYVILGAGLDTFAQRRPDVASKLTVYEIDQPGPQAWKRERLEATGFGVPPYLKLVPVDFEAGNSWLAESKKAGFDAGKPALVVSTGVSMYLTVDATKATLREVASLAPGSTYTMSFLVPMELADAAVRPGMERSAAGAKASGTPFISFYTPDQMLQLAREAGFKKVEHVSSGSLAKRYFSGRSDGLRPPDSSEELLVAST